MVCETASNGKKKSIVRPSPRGREHEEIAPACLVPPRRSKHEDRTWLPRCPVQLEMRILSVLVIDAPLSAETAVVDSTAPQLS